MKKVTTSPPMDDYQWTAVSAFLCEWPTDLSYESLIAHLNQDDKEHEELIVWEPFVN